MKEYQLISVILFLCSVNGGVNGIGPPLPVEGVRLYTESLMREAVNFSMIDEQDLSAKEGLWCQSDINNTKNTGVWYLPNGTEVTNNIHLPVNVSYESGQIGLFRINGIEAYQGLFTCVIQDQYDVNQTLVVAIYTTSEYGLRSNNFGTGLPVFKLLSPRDSDPPVFTISFNVTDRPPTNVTCMRSEEPLMISDSDINRVILSGEDPVNVTVIVTFRTREPGEYVCIVTATNQNPKMTSTVGIEVLETPENLTQIRTGFDSVIVNWKFPVRMNLPSGYEVFYETGNSSRQSIERVNTSVNILLEGDQNYTVFIVAYGTGSTLPSEPSEKFIITQVLSFIINGHSEAHSVSDNVTLYCETKVFIEMLEISLSWIDVYDLKINGSDNFIISEMSTNNIVMLELQIRDIQLVQAGIYTCEANVTFLETSQKISRTHAVVVQAPAPFVDVSIKAITNGHIYDTGRVVLLCMVFLHDFDANIMPQLEVSWSGPTGLIQNDSRYSFGENSSMDILSTNYSLTISDLDINNDNNTIYTCNVSVSAHVNYSEHQFIQTNFASDVSSPLTIENLPIPHVSITLDREPIIGEKVKLICNVSVIDSTLVPNVSLSWSVNGTMNFSSNASLFVKENEYLSLLIDPVDRIHNGIYTCTAELQLDGVQRVTNDSENYELFAIGPPRVSIVEMGSNIANSFNLTLVCTVRVDKGILIVTWRDSMGSEVLNTTNTSVILKTEGRISILQLQFSELQYSFAGLYTCHASLSLDIKTLNGSEVYFVQVQIPPPTVMISQDSPLIALHEATQQILTCNATLSLPLPETTNVDIKWSREGQSLDNDATRVTVTLTEVTAKYSYVSKLIFLPVGLIDSGSYRCVATVSTNEDNLLNNTALSKFNITVQDFPTPLIYFNTSNSPSIGDEYTLMCIINTSDSLYNTTFNTSLTRNGTVLNYTKGIGDSSVYLIFTPLLTSDIGMYECEVSVTQPSINLSQTFSNGFNISSTIPQPAISITTDTQDSTDLLEGVSLTLVCSSNISNFIDTDVEITFQWILNYNDTPLSNNTKYTIDSVTKLSPTAYQSRLMINELDTSDNGAIYSCSVSILSNQEHLTDTTINESITLEVREFTSNDLNIILSSQIGVATAGEDVTLHCSVTVPNGFVLQPDNISFAYDEMGSLIVSTNRTNTSQTNISKSEENVYESILTISTVRTSDARVYYCIVKFLKVDVMAVNSSLLSVKIPAPSVSISSIPKPPIYENTRLNLSCRARASELVDTIITTLINWTDNIGEYITTDPHLTVHSVGTISKNNFESVLEFDPVDNGDNGVYNDSKSYTCHVRLRSDNELIIEGEQNETSDINVKEVADFATTVSSNGSRNIRSNFSLTCQLETVPGLIGNSTLSWQNSRGNIVEISQYSGTNLTEVTFNLNPLMFEDRGLYICIASFMSSVTNDMFSNSTEYNLTVQIPPPTLSIGQSYNGTLYAGTTFQLNCNITLDPTVSNFVNITYQWLKDGEVIVTDGRLSSNIRKVGRDHHFIMLVFHPLDNAYDSGQYQCNVTVSADMFAIATEVFQSTNITIEELPNPIVKISSSGQGDLGSSLFNLSCSVEVIKSLIVHPSVRWTKKAVDSSLIDPSLTEIDTTLYGNQLNVSFKMLTTSDSGLYSCEGVINITQINQSSFSSKNVTLEFNIPTPQMMVEFSWGSNDLNVRCIIRVSEFVNTGVEVNVTWFKITAQLTMNLFNNTRTAISPVHQLSSEENLYQSSYLLSSPTRDDSGIYKCSANVISQEGYLYIKNSDQNQLSVNISIAVPSYPPTNFSVASRSSSFLIFQWYPPIEPNGPITNYTLKVFFNNGSKFEYIVIPLGPEDAVTYTLNGLNPYQQVIANVSASTVEGSGPESMLSTRTLEGVPGPVANLSVSVINSSDVVIMWSNVEEPNGEIIRFNVFVSIYQGIPIETIMVNSSEFSTQISGLVREKPYHIEVTANNSGMMVGTPATLTFFTVEGVPPAPNNITAIRLNGSHLIVKWNQIPLIQSKGFIQNYTVSYRIQNSTKRQSSMKIVSGEESSALIGNLIPTANYDVSVAASTNAGTGEFSEATSSQPLNTQRFQVRGGSFDNCPTQNTSYEEMIIALIKSSIVDAVRNVCDCDFSLAYINQGTLMCIIRSEYQVVYRATITEYNETFTTRRLIQIIEDYVSESPTVSSQGLTFTFNSDCTVVIEPDDAVCGIEVPSSSAMPTESIPPSEKQASSLLYIIIGSTLGVLLIVIPLIVVIVLTFAVMKSNKSAKRKKDIELLAYTKVIVNKQVPEADTPVDEQRDGLAELPGRTNPVESVYAELSGEKRRSELFTLGNPLYDETEAAKDSYVLQNVLYAEADVATNTRVLKNALYGDKDDIDYVPSQRMNSISNTSVQKKDEEKYVHAEVNKVKNQNNETEVIENMRVQQIDDTNQYAVVQKKEDKTSNSKASEEERGIVHAIGSDQYEAPWSAKYRSLSGTSQSFDSDSKVKAPFDLPPKSTNQKGTSQTAGDTYEAPWSNKYRSLSKSVTEAEYEDASSIRKEKREHEPLQSSTQLEDQYEAPWSAKYRSLTFTSQSGEGDTLVSSPIDIPSKSMTKTGGASVSEDTYEAPWSNKFRSLTRSVTEAEYEDARSMPKNKNAVDFEKRTAEPEDQYEAPWSAKYRSLTRGSQSFDDDTVSSCTPSNLPLKSKTQKGASQAAEDMYKTPWSTKYRSLTRSHTETQYENGRDFPKVEIENLDEDSKKSREISENLYDDTVYTKSIPKKTEVAEEQYETPWSSKYRSLSCNSDTKVASDIPRDEEVSKSVHNPLEEHKTLATENVYALPGMLLTKSETNANSSEENFAKDEYETLLPSPQRKIQPSAIVSTYDEVFVPLSPSKQKSLSQKENDGVAKQPISSDDVYSTPFDSLSCQKDAAERHISENLKPCLPSENRTRVKSIPSKLAALTTSTPIKPLPVDIVQGSTQGEYSVPFDSKRPRRKLPNQSLSYDSKDGVYPMPDNQTNALLKKSTSKSPESSPSKLPEIRDSSLYQASSSHVFKSKTLSHDGKSDFAAEKSRHQSASEDKKKHRGGLFSRALKLNKRQDRKSQSKEDGSNSENADQLYETISTVSRSSPTVDPSEYSTPFDSIGQSDRLSPIFPLSTNGITAMFKVSGPKPDSVQVVHDHKQSGGEPDKSNIEETYSDPIDSIAGKIPRKPHDLNEVQNADLNGNNSKPSVTSTPVPYEIPADILSNNSGQSATNELSSSKALDSPMPSSSSQEVQPYEICVIGSAQGTEATADKPQPYETLISSNDGKVLPSPDPNQMPLPKNDKISPSKLPEMYEIPISTVSTENTVQVNVAGEKEVSNGENNNAEAN